MITTRPHVLIVEDDLDTARLVQLILEKQGYAARIAFDARQALALALSELPGLILLDNSLSGSRKDGLALLADMRAMPDLENVPIIMLTANGTPEVVIQAIRNRVTDFIAKPFDTELLVQRVMKHVTPPLAAPETGAAPGPKLPSTSSPRT